MKLSLVIPTRERAGYLALALQSALLAADKAGCPVEIVVSDNASADDTAAVLAGIDDPRIVKLRSDLRLSMRENFELALSHTTGSHVVFIGDDDAVLPNGLRILSRLIADRDPDIVKWRVLNFVWPDPAAGFPGQLKIRPQLLDGRLRQIDPRAVLDGFARAEFKSYHDGGMIYHGCVSRRLIDAAVARSGGPYFRGSSPDVFTSLQALMVTERPMIRINLPITLGGASPRSNGAAGQKAAVAGNQVAGTEFSRFITESSTDPYQCRLPARCQSLAMLVLDCLQTAARVQGKAIEIDLAAWQARITQDITGFAEPARSESVDLAREVFGMEITLRAAPVAAVPRERSPAASSAPAAEQPDVTRLRHRPTTLAYSGGDTMADAANVAAMLDRLLDLEHFGKPTSGALSALLRVLQIHARAKTVAI